MSEAIWFDEMPSPVGPLRLVADEYGLRQIAFDNERHPKRAAPYGVRAPQAVAFARKQLEEYFAGTRQVFELPLHPLGTPFQRTVWRALAEIPYGTTVSYGELARRLGEPRAVRAVGAANGRNPLPIVLSCHRVIGADGSLTGFAGGLPVKQALLALERRMAQGDLFG